MRPKFADVAVGERRVEVHLVERVEQLAAELEPHPLASRGCENSLDTAMSVFACAGPLIALFGTLP